MTVTLRKRESAAVWAERVAQWRASGLSAERFARRAGLSPHTLRWWAWKLGASRPAATPTFLPVQVVSTPTSGPAPVEIALRNGRIVRVLGTCDPEHLAAVLRVADEAPC